MYFDRPDESFEFIVWYSSITVHVNGSVSVVAHKTIEQNLYGRHLESAFHSYEKK